MSAARLYGVVEALVDKSVVWAEWGLSNWAKRKERKERKNVHHKAGSSSPSFSSQTKEINPGLLLLLLLVRRS